MRTRFRKRFTETDTDERKRSQMQQTRHNSLDQGSFCTSAVLAYVRHVLRVDDNEQETTRVSHQVAEASATAAGEAPRNGSRRLRSSSGAISIIVITHASFTLAHSSVANSRRTVEFHLLAKLTTLATLIYWICLDFASLYTRGDSDAILSATVTAPGSVAS